ARGWGWWWGWGWGWGWRRLVVAIAGLVVPLGVALTVAAALDVPEPTLRTVGTLVVSPLWFLLPYVVFTAVARPVTAAVRRVGPAPIAVPAAVVVLAADRGLGVLPLTLAAAWLVPFVLGVGLATGRLGGRRTALVMLTAGSLAVVALIALGYPDSAVGVPGAARSNLDPPSLAAVGLAVAQVGAALLALPWLRRHAGRAVAALNRHATTVYLWHQPTLVATAVAAAWLSGGRPVPGVLNPPGVGWLADRLAWMGGITLTVALFMGVGRTVYDRRWFASPARPTEVIAVRDSDPPSRSRATAQPR
ncbi:MAG TPA: acyltransferase, partial [Asanoa sp.]